MPSTKTPRRGKATVYPFQPITSPDNARARVAYGDERAKRLGDQFGQIDPWKPKDLTKSQKYR